MKNKFLKNLSIATCLMTLLVTPTSILANETSTPQNPGIYNSIISDFEMNRRIEELGRQIANKKNSSRGATDEYWYVESQNKIFGNSAISSKYIRTLAIGETAYPSTVTFDFGGSNIGGYDINAGVSYSAEYSSFSGPSYSDTVGNSSIKATHSILTAVQYGSLVEYKYRVETALGNFVRYETIRTIVNGGTYFYNLRANISSRFVIEGSQRNRVKTFNSERDYIGSLGDNRTYNVIF